MDIGIALPHQFDHRRHDPTLRKDQSSRLARQGGNAGRAHRLAGDALHGLAAQRDVAPRHMKKLRVMMVVHHTLVPPDDLRDKSDPRMEKFRTEYDVKNALINLGHEVQVVGVYDDLAPIRKKNEEWKPHIAFNLLEDFAGNSAFYYYVVSYFEMMRIPYTGCNPRRLLLRRDKALTKMILTYHRISVPDFDVIRLRH